MSRVYVRTYRKYDKGWFNGKWLDLSDYDSKEDFLAAAREVHHDEINPQLMFCYWKGIPDNLIVDWDIDERVWQWLALSETEREAVSAYMEEVDVNAAVEEALECFEGIYDSEADWAFNFWDETGMLAEVPEFARGYIDFEQYARDARLGGDMTFTEKQGRVRAFRRS